MDDIVGYNLGIGVVLVVAGIILYLGYKRELLPRMNE
jgi:hypothetical protein